MNAQQIQVALLMLPVVCMVAVMVVGTIGLVADELHDMLAAKLRSLKKEEEP